MATKLVIKNTKGTKSYKRDFSLDNTPILIKVKVKQATKGRKCMPHKLAVA